VPETPDTDEAAATVDALLDAVVERLGGERREGQHAMARAAANAFSSGRHLLVQAGTGTGKSLGYLVPALRHAVLADERVIVSTATLALQRQILTRDLPLVCDVIAPTLPRRPTTALLKGWHNYVCVHKIAGGYPVEEQGSLLDVDPGDERAGAAQHPPRGPAAAKARASAASDLGRDVLRLRAWAESSETGDRDDCVPGVSDRAWRQVSVTALECLGQKCPMIDDCFPERARSAAREADLVVTNHAMLGIAASGSPGVLPEHSALVVDEAHELTDRVTAQATWELSVASVEHAARFARRHGGLESTPLDAAAAALGAALADLPDGRLPGHLPGAVHDAVTTVRDAARTLLSALKPEPSASTQQPDAGRKLAQSAVLQLFEVADRMAAEPQDAVRDVRWCSRGGGDGAFALPRLSVAPLDVSGLVRAHLLDGRTAVLTSATLTLGGSFDPLARSLGLAAQAGRREWRPGTASTSAARSTTRARASSTSRSTCRRRAVTAPRRRCSTSSPSWSWLPAAGRSDSSRPGARRRLRRRPSGPGSTHRCCARATTSCLRSSRHSRPTTPPPCSAPSRSGRAWMCRAIPVAWW